MAMILDDKINTILEERAWYIQHMLSDEELLAQIAEEAAELSHAALKLRRVLDGSNPTPVTKENAMDDLIEEFGDIILAMRVYGLDYQDVQDTCLRKSARWMKRLNAKKDGEEIS